MRRFVVVVTVLYLALVGAGVALIFWRNTTAPPTAAKKVFRSIMTIPDSDWKPIDDVEVPAKPSALWTLASEYVRGPALIRFSTDPSAKWKYASESACTADGDMASMISPQASVLPGAPIGALIAKIGGSTAGQSDGKLFLVGSFAIIELDANTRGPMYLTINDESSGMENNSGTLRVNLRVKTLPQPATPAATSSAGTKP